MKNACCLCFAFLFISLLSYAGEADVPEMFRGHAQDNKLYLQYDDLDTFLKTFVSVTGWSERQKAENIDSRVGTRLKVRINPLTVLEGNKFYFTAFDNEQVVSTLADMQASLMSLPDDIPLPLLSADEQLAYWLNLYNFTMLNEIAKPYPVYSMSRYLNPDEDKYFLDEKVMTVAGIPLSLNDIKDKILKEKYDSNPLILYGLFQGNIGGPGIQKRAFRSRGIWRTLKKSATEFINSNRGTYYDGKVSVFYERNLNWFNNDEAALKAHILTYLGGEMTEEIDKAKSLDFAMKDWQLASVMGDQRSYGGSGATNSAAMLDSVVVSGSTLVPTHMMEEWVSKTPTSTRLSPSQLAVLDDLRTRFAVARGSVSVTDLSEEEAKSDKDQ